MAALLALWSKRWTLLPLAIGTWNTTQWLRHVEGRDVTHILRPRWWAKWTFVTAIVVHLRSPGGRFWGLL